MIGLPKVKRDKFSVFNFLTVTESRETTGRFIHLQGSGDRERSDLLN